MFLSCSVCRTVGRVNSRGRFESAIAILVGRWGKLSLGPSDLTHQNTTTQAKAWAKLPRPFGPGRAVRFPDDPAFSSLPGVCLRYRRVDV
jgi:hypothetical protein